MLKSALLALALLIPFNAQATEWFDSVHTETFSYEKRDESSGATVNALDSSKSFVKLTATVTTINGIVAPSAPFSRMVIVSNQTGGTVTFNHQSGSASAANRLTLQEGEALEVPDGGTATFIYDHGSTSYVVGGGGGGGTDFDDFSASSPLSYDGTGGFSAPTVVVGPGSATANAVARYDGTTGKLIKNSGCTIDDSGNLSCTSFVGPLTGNASTASALASNPTDCSGPDFATAIAANGNLTCVRVHQGPRNFVQNPDALVDATTGITAANTTVTRNTSSPLNSYTGTDFSFTIDSTSDTVEWTLDALDGGTAGICMAQVNYTSATASIDLQVRNNSTTVASYTLPAATIAVTQQLFFGCSDHSNAYTLRVIGNSATSTAVKMARVSVFGPGLAQAVLVLSNEKKAIIVNPAGTPSVSTQSSPSWISSITDNGTGDITLNYVTGSFSNTPVCVATFLPNSGTARTISIQTQTSSALRLRSFNSTDATDLDGTINVSCGEAQPPVSVNVAAAGDHGWIPYTPTYQGFGTPSSIEMYFRRVGDSIQIMGNHTNGTVTGSEAQFGLPPGLSVASVPVPTIRIVGQVTRNATSSGSMVASATGGQAYLTLGADTASGGGFAKQNGNFLATGDKVGILALVPIQGFSTFPLALAGTVGNEIVRVSNCNGHGSGNNKFRRWSNIREQSGTAIVYTDDATDGGKFTLTRDGIYSIDIFDNHTGTITFGASVDSAEGTTSVDSIVEASFRGRVTHGNGVIGQYHLSEWFPAGTVIREHTDGAPSATGSFCRMTVTKVN